MSVELLGIAAALLVGLGAAETLVHRRRLRRIPIRVHVSGTRGKSSVTRLIAAGLREAGVRTAAKTTGTLARMILPDAREVPIYRPTGPNIIEQTRIVATAQELEAQALVIECMALQPELHWLSESQLIRATHAVITNVRPDHLDVMGPTEADVARALAGMTPRRGVLVTTEREHLAILAHAAKDRDSRLVAVDEDEVLGVTDEELARFHHVEHRANVAVALRLLSELEVDRQVALDGMWRSKPDPGALTFDPIDFHGRRIVFVNGFAANDPRSTETIWRMARARFPEIERVVAVFNLRGDRPLRTVQLAGETSFWHEADRVVLMGTGSFQFAREASKAGLDATRFIYAEHEQLEEVFEAIVEQCGAATLVIGMANIGGQGLELVRHFRNRRRLEEVAS